MAWDDLCNVPFPGLDRLLVVYAEQSPEAGEREIERLINNYPSQRVAALRARTRLLARSMAHQTHLANLDATASCLPEGERGFLAQTPRLRQWIADIARQQRHLDTVSRPIFLEPLAVRTVQDIEKLQPRRRPEPADRFGIPQGCAKLARHRR